MESIAHAAIKVTASGRRTYNINHRHCYGIKQWATILTSVPRTHNLPLQQQLSKAHYATAARGGGGGTRHEKASAKMRMAPRAAYQPTNASTWIISDGSVSADKEAVNLAKGLSLPWQIKRVQWRKGLQWLPIPFKKLIMDYHHVVNRKQTDRLPWFLTGDSLAAPYPSFVIGAGAKAIPGILQVSRMSGKASFSSYIHFPALPFIHFDQVFLQRHEVVVQLAALGLMKDQKNYFRINSTLNSITPKSLQLATTRALDNSLIPKSFFRNNAPSSSSLGSMPADTIVAVLIGGPNEDCSHHTDRMVHRLARLVDVQNCHVMITFSQRTADNTKKAIAKWQKQVQNDDKIFVYDPMTPTTSPQDSVTSGQVSWPNVPGPKGVMGFMNDRNPYEAMLALADKIVVTADSVAMTNEALATGKPVYILGGELARGKLKVFHRYLTDLNMTRAFRPGRIPILPSISSTGRAEAITNGSQVNDTADPLSYPGDHPPWKNTLEGKGPEEAKRLAERLVVLRECRLAGKRVPAHVADATC
ncbi:MAG: mitochondrial fission ELM1-domain-containing protein [Linnemannia elongata]|nr:MAG: mitochondrial fission ELM1-domain-containing protein [Linnemannia elongata]